ncbi:MAG: hypothetical protein AB8F94_14515 [Saprospiraceae bacterium]
MNKNHLTLFVIVVLCFLFFSCQKKQYTSKTVQGEEPRTKSFWYYQNNFFLDPNLTELRTDGIYFKIIDTDQFGDTYKTFRFYEDGLVISHVAYSTPEKLMELNRTTQGNIHGYYKVKNDSLFFTTKVYYNHSPTFYTGFVYPDSMSLNSINFKTRESDDQVFYFLKKEE